ncbi:glycosyl transferase family protein [Paraburkholderia sp. D15]|uniref:glycosyl transferase family protein n=1 Tax=Paraburkholderia sp. D15 TaxID=2880218 RepID=UPI002479575E|nr:glycosyl transferase family protein [Paraburkholderia sp. D15]WGS53255.1 glycosyl transferase family protein [Paraburkholderia sp. D15]
MILATLKWYGAVLLAQYYQTLEQVATVVAAIILLSSLDDLFIDLWYWIRQAVRHFTVERQYKPLTAAQLHQREEQPIAIMIPAWQEHDVIAAMIEDMVRVLDYRAYTVFVGTYQNDPATIAEVERMRHRYKHLHRVEVPHDGPTCKADCLNWIVQAILHYEFEAGTEFAGVVMHDSEDVLHPLELKFFNYLLPRKDMIQLPVASLERDWYELVAGTYMDEFAEWHAKDLVVRESLAGSVPSAGVGTCFSRRAMLALIEETQSQPFNTESLTEDYDVGSRISRLGMHSIFPRFPVQYATRRRSWFGLGPERDITVTMPLCVREFFPDTLRTAYRQRARWTLGIGLQGWKQTGWSGSIANRYLLLRDRKGVVTAFVGMLAYLLVLQFLLFAMASFIGLAPNLFPSPFIDSTWTQFLLAANFVSLGLRVVQRVIFTTRLYGWEHGVLSVPRMVIGNFVNFLAVFRAWRLFLVHVITGKRLAWDKTMHDFPSADGLRNTRQNLGELLLSWQAIDERKLELALNDRHAREAPLGRVLMARGWLDEETLAEAIAFQSDLPRGRFDAALLESSRDILPIDVLVRLRVLPQGIDEDGHLILAAASLPGDEALAELHDLSGHTVTVHIVRESEVSQGLRILRDVGQQLVAGGTWSATDNGSEDETSGESPVRGVPLLGDLLIEMGLVTRAAFEAALKTYRPDRDGRIGDYMVARHVISRDALRRAIEEQQRIQHEPTVRE